MGNATEVTSSSPPHRPPTSRYREGMRRWRCGLGLLPAINEMLKRIKQEVNSSIQMSPSLLESRLPIPSHRHGSPRAWMGSRAEHFSRLLHRFFLKALSPFFFFFCLFFHSPSSQPNISILRSLRQGERCNGQRSKCFRAMASKII